MTFTFKSKRKEKSKKKRIKFWEEKLKRAAGGRNKIPKAKLAKLLYGEPKSPLYKPKVKPKGKPKVKPEVKSEVKPAEKNHIRFRRKK